MTNFNDNSSIFGNHVRGLDGDAVNPGDLGNPAKTSSSGGISTYVRPQNGLRAYAGNGPVTDGTGNAVSVGTASSSTPAAPSGRVDTSTAFENGRAMLPHEFTERTVVKVDGMEVSIGVAARMGLMVKGANGQWEAVANAATPATQPQQQQQGASRNAQRPAPEEAPAPLPLPPATAHALNEAFDADPSAASSIANAVLAGRDPTAHIAQLASQSGKEPAQVQAQLSDTIAVFAGRAMDHVTQQLGGDADMAEAAMTWARDTRMDDLQRADAAFWKTGRPDYRGVVQDYIADLGRSDPGRVLAMAAEAGLRARKVSGEVVVDVPGTGQVGWKVTVKQGLVRFAK